MKLRVKIAILIIAIIITFVGFNLLVFPSALELMNASQNSDYEVPDDSTAVYLYVVPCAAIQ